MNNPAFFVFLGAPGLGKSTVAGSICEVVSPAEVLLLVCKAGEDRSWLYQKYGLANSAEYYLDPSWCPELGQYEATDYKRLLRRIWELRKDTTYGGVILDPGTDASQLIEHDILGASKVGSVGELGEGGRYGFYAQLADRAQGLIRALGMLTTGAVARPKIVIVTWHTQPAKEGGYQKDPVSGQKVYVEAGDERAAGIEYEGLVLPALEGKYRRKLAADVDFVGYCDFEERAPTKEEYVKGQRDKVSSYFVQVRANAERHAKVRMAPALRDAKLPNNMSAILAAIEEARDASA